MLAPMPPHDIYVYGMTVLSTIHLLDGPYPPANSYREIKQTHVIPGGEAANAAIVLAGFGWRTMLDGCCLGEQTHEPVLQHLAARGVDCSLMTRLPGFIGWRDIVLCDGSTRSVFGWFIADLFGGRRLWTVPSELAIRQSKCVALDPFFGAESAQVAELCVRHGVDYVTIDCRPDSPVARNARAVICSQEFLDREYPKAEPAELLAKYRAACRGLVIFTFGARSILYASPQTAQALVPCYKVKVVDTLAAGDSFRAGVIHALLNGMDEERTVRFGAATAGVVCTRFPGVQEPPTLNEIADLMAG
jgi:sugar/nucleoside kinase (ribokinase family)